MKIRNHEIMYTTFHLSRFAHIQHNFLWILKDFQPKVVAFDFSLQKTDFWWHLKPSNAEERSLKAKTNIISTNQTQKKEKIISGIPIVGLTIDKNSFHRMATSSPLSW